VSLTNDDRAALLLAADLCARYSRPGLADRLKGLALAPPVLQKPLLPPPPPEPVQPRRAMAVQPGDDMAAVARQMRLLGDEDLYAVFRQLDRDRPSKLTALIWARVEQARRGRE